MEREKLIATVTAAQSGDSEALNELFNAFYNDVYYFALKTVKDDDLACDITQETFVEIINTIGDLHEPAAFVKWMKQITYHQCTRYFKKKKDVLVDEDEEGNTIFDTLAEDKTEFIPDEALDQQDFRDTILAMLDELSEEQRSATMLYYYDELSVKQIAEIQNVSEGTVKSRLNYARKSIKNSVETYEKKNGVKLHCAGVLPLLLWLLSQTGKETMPAAAANAVAGGVTAATGVTVSAAAAAGGAAVATATATTVATASGVGIAAKIAALPVITKVIASVVAGLLVIGGIGMAVWPEKESAPTENAPQATTEPMDTGSTDEQTEVAGEVIPAGCKYIMTDGTELQAGEYMPKVPGKNDQFVTADYRYSFSGTGWKSSVLDKSKTEYEPLLATINGYPLKAVYFADCQNMISAPILPDTVTDLDSAFYGCSSMTAAPVIPQGVKNLSLTFAHCVSLKVAPVIPDGVWNLWSTFEDCISLEVAPELPTGVTDLAMTFQGCSSLKTAPVIPQGVTDLGFTFADCVSLEAAPVIPEAVTDLSYTFSGCTSLTAAPVIPESVTDLLATFIDCVSLETAPVIPKSVAYMDSTFYGCTSLTGIIEINAMLAPCIESCNTDAISCIYCYENEINCMDCWNCMAYRNCFYDTEAPITLTGSCENLAAMAATGNNGNVKLEADTVYQMADAASSIELIESWVHNWPDFGESETAMTQFGRNYIIAVSGNPVCRIRSVEVISASVDGVACEVYQTRSKEKAATLVEKYHADFAVETEVLTVVQVVSPKVEMDRTGSDLNVDYEVILRFTLENGQVMDLRYTDDVIVLGTGGVLTDCTPEDFQ